MWVLDLLRKLKGRADEIAAACDSVFADLIFTTAWGTDQRGVLGQEAFQTTPARSRLAEHPAVRSPPHICHSSPDGWSRTEGGVRATWTCERRVHPRHLLARASAYAGRGCFQDGSSPAEGHVVVTHSPAKTPKHQSSNSPGCCVLRAEKGGMAWRAN